MKQEKFVKRWFITINNEEMSDSDFFRYCEELEHVKYFAFQREKGHEKETEHIHLFIIFNISKRFSTIKTYFPRARIEEVKGSNAQARDYATKSDTRVSGPFEYGELVEKGGRTDLSTLYDLLEENVSNDELMKICPTTFIRYKKTIEDIRQEKIFAKMKKRGVRPVEVIYVYGPPGTGKTSSIYRKYGFDEFYRVTDYKHPFDKYSGEEIVVFDEYDSQLSFDSFLNYIDVYPADLPCRFANKCACWTKVYIISNLSIDEQYRQIKEEQPKRFEAFKRRINVILYFSKEGVQVISQKINGAQLDLVEKPMNNMPF